MRPVLAEERAVLWDRARLHLYTDSPNLPAAQELALTAVAADPSIFNTYIALLLGVAPSQPEELAARLEREQSGSGWDELALSTRILVALLVGREDKLTLPNGPELAERQPYDRALGVMIHLHRGNPARAAEEFERIRTSSAAAPARLKVQLRELLIDVEILRDRALPARAVDDFLDSVGAPRRLSAQRDARLEDRE
jgi:hypothetical protein